MTILSEKKTLPAKKQTCPPKSKPVLLPFATLYYSHLLTILSIYQNFAKIKHEVYMIFLEPA